MHYQNFQLNEILLFKFKMTFNQKQNKHRQLLLAHTLNFFSVVLLPAIPLSYTSNT